MVLFPNARLDVEKVATPPLSVLVVKVVAPFLKVTVPTGIPPKELIVAVNVTDWPGADGFGEDVSEAAVRALFTTCFSDEVLELNDASPL